MGKLLVSPLRVKLCFTITSITTIGPTTHHCIILTIFANKSLFSAFSVILRCQRRREKNHNYLLRFLCSFLGSNVFSEMDAFWLVTITSLAWGRITNWFPYFVAAFSQMGEGNGNINILRNITDHLILIKALLRLGKQALKRAFG